VAIVIYAPQCTVSPEGSAVRTLEDALSPGIEELPVLLKDEDSMFATGENVNASMGIDDDIRDLSQGRAGRQSSPISGVFFVSMALSAIEECCRHHRSALSIEAPQNFST